MIYELLDISTLEEINTLKKENKQLKEIIKKIKKEIANLNKCDINEHNLYMFLLKIDEILKGENNENN